jgi:type III secretion protein J
MKALRVLRWAALALVLPLAACQSELYSGLGEKEANEIVATLADASITASRAGNKEGAFSVQVDGSMMSEATRVLSAHGLPRPKFQSLGQVFETGGMVATPFEQRAKFMFALDQELSHSISQIGGVSSARVHVMLPETSALDVKKERPRASVFIYVDPGADVSKQTGVIKSLVMNAVNNLAYEDIAVAFFPSATLDSSPGRPAARKTDYSLAGVGAFLTLVIAFIALRPRGRAQPAVRPAALPRPQQRSPR